MILNWRWSRHHQSWIFWFGSLKANECSLFRRNSWENCLVSLSSLEIKISSLSVGWVGEVCIESILLFIRRIRGCAEINLISWEFRCSKKLIYSSSHLRRKSNLIVEFCQLRCNLVTWSISNFILQYSGILISNSILLDISIQISIYILLNIDVLEFIFVLFNLGILELNIVLLYFRIIEDYSVLSYISLIVECLVNINVSISVLILIYLNLSIFVHLLVLLNFGI